MIVALTVTITVNMSVIMIVYAGISIVREVAWNALIGIGVMIR